LGHKLVSGRAERPLALPEEVVMSITQSNPTPALALSKEEAEWLLSVLHDEDWGGLWEGVPLTQEEALRVASS
jgi:hypothetical protein